MADPFALMTSGQPLESGTGPFNVQWHNAVTESVRAFRRNEVGEPRQKSVEMPYDPFVWLANVSGETLPQFSAIGIGKLLTFPTSDDQSDFRYRMCFYSAPLVAGRPFAITQSTIHANDKFAAKRAVVAGEEEPPSSGWVRVIGTATAWSVTERYAIGEQVTYGGDTYVCIKPHTGQTPATGSYWVKLGMVRGLWESDSAYAIGEIVPRANVGEIVMDGVSRLLLNVGSSKHQYAGIDASGEMVSQATEGPLKIIVKVDGTGPQWAIVRFMDGTATLPVCTGTGAITLSAATCDGDGTFLYTPGGAITLGAATCSGTGTFTPPVFTGSGTPSTGAVTCAGVGKSYSVPPSGRLYNAAVVCVGVGTFTPPPVGFGRIKLAAVTCSGTGTVTKPTFTGSGAITLGAATCKGRGPGMVTSDPNFGMVSYGTTGATTTPQDWICPEGVTSILVECWGAGGAGQHGVSPSGGGGGGAYAYSVLTVVPGTTYKVRPGRATDTTVGPPVVAESSWFSLTGSIPTSAAEGTLAVPGEVASGTTGGAGGLSSACYGDAAYSGGSGGNAGGGVSGSGGGAAFDWNDADNGDDGWAGDPWPRGGDGSYRGVAAVYPEGTASAVSSNYGVNGAGSNGNVGSGSNGRVTISWGNDAKNQLVQSINNHTGPMWIVGRRGIKVSVIGASNFVTVEPDNGFVTWFVGGGAPVTDGQFSAYPFVDYPGPLVHFDTTNGVLYQWSGSSWDVGLTGLPSGTRVISSKLQLKGDTADDWYQILPSESF